MAMLSMNPTMTMDRTTTASWPRSTGKRAPPVNSGRPAGMWSTMGMPRPCRSMVACRTMQTTVTMSGPAARVHLKRGYRTAIFLRLMRNNTQAVPRTKVFQLNSEMLAKRFRRRPWRDLLLGMLYPKMYLICDRPMMMAAAEVKPLTTAWLRKMVTKPRRSTPMRM